MHGTTAGLVAAAAALGSWLVGALGGCALEFSCSEDAQCTLDGRAGVCEIDGFCSFPDPRCDSGRRYHRSASSTLAGTCTVPGSGSSEGSSTTIESPDPTDSSDDAPPDLPSVPSCGDGFVDEGEECDDGNAVDGDGCNRDCVPSGTVVWNAEYSGLDDGDDDAWGLGLSPAGDVVVAGRVGLDGDGSTAAWVRMYDADGNELWTREVVHGDAGRDGALAVALHATEGLFVGGWAATTLAESGLDDEEDFWLARLDLRSGQVEAQTVFDGDGGPDRIRGLSFSDGGELLAAGWAGAGAGSTEDLWYGRFDPQTLELGAAITLDEGANERAHQPAPLPSGGMAVAGSVHGPRGPQAWLRLVDAAGEPTLTRTFAQASLWTDVEPIPGSADLMVAGTLFSGLAQAVALRVDDRGATVWSAGWSGPVPAPRSEIYGMAVGPSGELVIAGRVRFEDVDEGWDAFLTKFDPAGQAQWTRTHSGSAGDADVASNVAIDTDGSVVLVGYRVSMSNGRNIWVRKYTP